MTKQDIQERIEVIIDLFQTVITEKDLRIAKTELSTLISDVVKAVIGEKEKEGKHDTCEVDGDSWCYSHGETIEEGTNTTYSSRNKLRSEQEAKRKELLG